MVETATDPRLTMTIREAAAYTGISRLRIAAAIRAGELPSIRIVRRDGTHYRVVKPQLEAWVLKLTEVPA